MEKYLQPTAIIDWDNLAVSQLAKQIASIYDHPRAIAQACFEWVRDEIYHSVDYQMNPVTCRASDVLKYKTGYCYAKSHLLAALLRANGIPTGFCYQRLSINDHGEPYCLHGFNGIYLPEFGWYRVDPRGNRPGINAEFTPPQEQLAYQVLSPEEVDFPEIFSDPLPVVVEVLEKYQQWDQVLTNLPDLSPDSWQK